MKTIIEPGRVGLLSKLAELISHKDLIMMLAYRDFKVRYAQTFLGILWVLIQPLLTLLVFAMVFGKALKVDTGGIPYPVFMICGMITWSLFSYILGQAGNSIISSQALVTKVYFPRLAIPVSKAMVGFVDFGVSLGLSLIFMAYYGIIPSVNIIFLPLFLLAAVVFSLSAGIIFSALTIRFRDFQYIIPFILQLGIYATPIAYPSHLIPEKYQVLYHLNPMAMIIDGCRFSMLGTPLPPALYLCEGSAIILLLLFLSLYMFNKIESKIADII